MKISNWGNYPAVDGMIEPARFKDEIREIIRKERVLIPRGLGRSYGDASLQEHMLTPTGFNRFISFDRELGILTCESGVSLAEILEYFVPRGWFLPVSPGTKFVTVGGAIASNIHGKNHHKEGTFCRYLLEMRVMLADGSVRNCSGQINPELFSATCGGMGLTGTILTATFRLKKIETSFISQQVLKTKNLDEIFKLFDETRDWTYSVAWLDCLAKGRKLGKSVLLLGEHTPLDELKEMKKKKAPLETHSSSQWRIPVYFPEFVLNNMSIQLFNKYYYLKARSNRETVIPYEPFFYPLDAIANWNKMYGKRGFLQYQFVLPLKNSYEGVKKILETISQKKAGSFLTVLKLFGKEDPMMSFPMEGYTLSLDFPATNRIFPVLDELDKLVVKYGGRIYLAKDARMKKETFRAGYPTLDKFMELKRKVDPENKFRSALSERLGL